MVSKVSLTPPHLGIHPQDYQRPAGSIAFGGTRLKPMEGDRVTFGSDSSEEKGDKGKAPPKLPRLHQSAKKKPKADKKDSPPAKDQTTGRSQEPGKPEQTDKHASPPATEDKANTTTGSESTSVPSPEETDGISSASPSAEDQSNAKTDKTGKAQPTDSPKEAQKSEGLLGYLSGFAELALLPLIPLPITIGVLAAISFGTSVLSKLSGAQFDQKGKITNRPEATNRISNIFAQVTTLPLRILPLPQTFKEKALGIAQNLGQGFARKSVGLIEARQNLGFFKWAALLGLLFLERRFAKLKLIKMFLNWTVLKNWRLAAQKSAASIFKNVIIPK